MLVWDFSLVTADTRLQWTAKRIGSSSIYALKVICQNRRAVAVLFHKSVEPRYDLYYSRVCYYHHQVRFNQNLASFMRLPITSELEVLRRC